MGWDDTAEEFDYEKADKGFEPIPVGDYSATVESAEPGEAKSSGNPVIVVKLTVDTTEGPRKMTDTMPFTQKALFRVSQIGKSAGVERPKNSTRSAAQAFCDELAGKNVRLKIKHEEYQGRTTYKVDRYLFEESAAAEPIAMAGGSRRRRG